MMYAILTVLSITCLWFAIIPALRLPGAVKRCQDGVPGSGIRLILRSLFIVFLTALAVSLAITAGAHQ